MSNPTPTPPLPQNGEQELRETLKRCSAETIEAAIQFRQAKNPELANAIVVGILARFLEREQREKLHGESDYLRLSEDLGVDSLTMVEVVMLVEEVLQISIKNEDLRDLRTIGDVKAYVNAVARGLPPPEPPKAVGIAEIVEVMPHQHPFLFLQEAELRAKEARGTYRISGQEFFLQGHFKDRPVFPASLQLEALGQLGVLLLLKGKIAGVEGRVDPTSIYFTSCMGIRCVRPCLPGDVLTLSVRPRRVKPPAVTFEGVVTVNGEKAAFAEEITLVFGYAAEGSGSGAAQGAGAGATTSAAAVATAKQPELKQPESAVSGLGAATKSAPKKHAGRKSAVAKSGHVRG
ncbi:MAG: phosphopantetheine-binding protein [Puniceicoccales bacterium]|jgi:3-hydroxyacyl-[acyl-carrier-protein] dehydratase|nr:phosphopantetheine-binding protein [Puniceicoccales bacterium]